jgi:hypothetical protein
MLIWNRPSSRTRALLSLTIIVAMTASFSVSPSLASRRAAPPSQGEATRAIGATAQRPPATTATSAPSTEVRARAQEAYARIEMSFEENRGQTADEVKFLARGGGYTLFLTGTEAVFVLARRSDAKTEDRQRERLISGDVAASASEVEPSEPPAVLRMKLEGANPRPTVSGLNELEGKVNYFIGNDPEKWHTEIPTFGRVRYEEVYQGVGMVYYGNQRQLEYDFVVAPGADYKQIALKFDGADGVELDSGSGDLLLRVGDEVIRQHRPVVYQEVNGERQEIESGYVLKGAGRVEFAVGQYDASKPLVIDPVLAYSTYLGRGADDRGNGIAVDAAGNAYVTGSTTSTDFPTTPGAFDTSANAGDVFVTKLNAAGSALAYSTYLGGSDGEVAFGVAVDAAGNAYVAGQTSSTDFPTTPGAFDTSDNPEEEAFVTKLNAAGSALAYSTYLGSGDVDIAYCIAVDTAGNAYVAGQTFSADFPTTPGAYDTTNNPGSDAFVTKLNAAGSALAYSTYLGGSSFERGNGIAVDAAGNAYVAGQTSSADFPTTAGAFDTSANANGDAFVTKLNAAGSALAYSTFLGGGGADRCSGIAVDAAGKTYVAGYTESTDFPTTAGAFDTTNNPGLDAFVTKLNADGSALAYSTYLGGGGDDRALGIAVDAAGNAYVTGDTSSADFPTPAGAFDTTFNPSQDAFVTKLNAAGSALAYSTYLGGGGGEIAFGIAVDAAGNAYVTGVTTSTDFPNTPSSFQETFSGINDAFVAKLGDYAIAGRVLDASNNGISGVTVTLSGANSAIATTDGSGAFSFLSTTSGGNYTVTPFKTNYTFTPSSININNLNNNQDLIFIAAATAPSPTPTPGSARVQFEFDTYVTPEDCSSIDVAVIRTGDISGALTVDYATSDGTAKQKGDYTITSGTLSFASGETRKTIPLLISEDVFNEGDENFSVNLFNLVGAATLDQPSRVTIVIADDDPSGATANPIDDTQTFVAQHYHDFLNRQPDQSGLLFWINNIDSCGANAQCRDARRIDTSASFFLSIEYQQTGFYAIRIQRTAFGSRSDTASTRVTYEKLVRDTRQVGDGVIVGQAGYETRLEQNKQNYATQIVTSAAFIARFPTSQTAAQYIDALYASAQVTPTTTERNDAITAFAGGGTAGRVAALRKIADSQSLINAEFSPAFVLLAYHGYLRRNPTDLPDTNDSGYQFWLAKLNSFGGDFRKADMVRAFITSAEYRLRFGPS